MSLCGQHFCLEVSHILQTGQNKPLGVPLNHASRCVQSSSPPTEQTGCSPDTLPLRGITMNIVSPSSVCTYCFILNNVPQWIIT